MKKIIITFSISLVAVGLAGLYVLSNFTGWGAEMHLNSAVHKSELVKGKTLYASTIKGPGDETYVVIRAVGRDSIQNLLTTDSILVACTDGDQCAGGKWVPMHDVPKGILESRSRVFTGKELSYYQQVKLDSSTACTYHWGRRSGVGYYGNITILCTDSNHGLLLYMYDKS